MARLQFWAETTSQALDGTDKEKGMIREWRDFQSQGHAIEKVVKLGFLILGGLCGIPAMLVTLSALGLVHLR